MLPLISALRVGLVVLMSSALYIHHTKYNGKPKALFIHDNRMLAKRAFYCCHTINLTTHLFSCTI